MSTLMIEPKNSAGMPWGGYAGYVDGVQVGECAFKGPPTNGRVEIAYHTFEAFRGRGDATAMARELIDIAKRADPSIVVAAQTLPETNASVSLLIKLGFVLQGTLQHPQDGLVWEWHLQRGNQGRCGRNDLVVSSLDRDGCPDDSRPDHLGPGRSGTGRASRVAAGGDAS